MEHNVKNSVIVAAGVVALLFETVAYGCTGFCVAQGETVLVGNNEDWRNRKTKVWYEPASNGKYGRVFFGFDNFYPQGGMNEKGLCFDGFATAPKKVTKSRHKPDFEGDNLLDAIMSQCATVEDVLKKFDKYNLESMSRAMLFFADDTGDAAIIEGDEVIRKKGRYQVVTNFYQSEVKREDVLCRRYKAADRMLAAADNVTIELCKQILDATHQEGRNPTVYSNIYDAKKRLVYLYHFHDFENVVVIDLARELKKGSRRLDLPALFARAATRGSEKDR